jgi:hypothetical protein
MSHPTSVAFTPLYFGTYLSPISHINIAKRKRSIFRMKDVVQLREKEIQDKNIDRAGPRPGIV